jgi:8-oxo-dGTP diphosphatase
MIKRTTLCYIEHGGAYLLLHRVKKKNDVNKGKWVGIGGHFLEGESPDECLVREVREETGILLTDYRFAGKIRFEAPPWPSEVMYLYRATVTERPPFPDCDEGVLAWVDKREALSLPMWEGDRVFFSLMEESTEPFSLLLRYEGERLVESRLGGDELFTDE